MSRQPAGKSPARVLLFTGDGKGKTTAALGLVLRASGHGMSAFVMQFIKSATGAGEERAGERLAGVTVEQCGRGFVRNATPEQLLEHAAAAKEGLARAAEALASGRYAVVVLDEVCTAVSRGLLAEAEVAAAVRAAPAGSIVVLTGRGATDALVALADTVTEMRCVKHGYQAGIAAQEGVEF